ncbi:MAG: hypothetical protein JNM94_12015 [Phycisphaerae bacterium]|nr:hypothetical protein [Phycisphaerae bacterium]
MPGRPHASTAKSSSSFTTNAYSSISAAPNAVGDPSRPPGLVVVTFRILVGAGLGFYFFVVFCIARASLGGFGMSTFLFLKCAAVSLIMGAFMVWLAPFLELPEIWYRHRLPSKRLARGECPDCGYPRAPGTTRCAECGSERNSPPPWQFGARTIRLFAIVATVSFVAGCGVALAWIAADERAFVREASLARGAYSRERAWPMQFAPLAIDDAGTLSAPTIAIEGERDPNWRPRRPTGNVE